MGNNIWDHFMLLIASLFLELINIHNNNKSNKFPRSGSLKSIFKDLLISYLKKHEISKIISLLCVRSKTMVCNIFNIKMNFIQSGTKLMINNCQMSCADNIENDEIHY